MPISGDVSLDPNTQRFAQPTDSCVGDDGPEPTAVTTVSTGSGRGPVSGYAMGKVTVVDSGPLGCAGADYNRNLDGRQA